MVRLLYLCGARSQEVTGIRPGNVVADGNVWIYRTRRHKTQHLDRAKAIPLGPLAQEVLRPWLDRDPGSYCFVPAAAAAWHRARTRRHEPSRRTPGESRGKTPHRGPGPR